VLLAAADSHAHGDEAMADHTNVNDSGNSISGIIAGVIAGVISGIGSRFLFQKKK
jgi:chorismate synthase